MKRDKRLKIKFRHKHPWIFHFFTTLLLLFSIASATVGGYLWYVLSQTPTVTEYQLKSDGTSNMYDVNGKVIWSSTETRRDYVKSENIPQLYKDLLLSTEDKTFYEDGGFSVKGLANAFYTTFMDKVFDVGESRGGSSIEQQLIKNVVFSTHQKDRTLERKIKELFLAQQMYENFGKDKILEYYVNKIFMGESSYGANTISITYYGKSLKDLSEKTPENVSKMAIIAGLGQAPSQYNLYDNPSAVQKRRDIVLLSTYKNKKISKELYEKAKKVDVKLDLKPRYWRNNEIHQQVTKYNPYVMSALNQVKQLGYDLEKTPLQIHTHLNPTSQDWLTNEVANYGGYQDEKHQIAITVLDTKTGVVIAQSGGRFEEAYGLNRATQRTRSSGSSIKPFIAYGPAIEYLGYGSGYILDSSNYVYPGTNIVAYNYGTATYGNVSMAYALQLSLNTPVTRLLDEHLGSSLPKKFLHNLGMDVKDYYGGVDGLGIDVSTADESAAFATIANGGVYNTPQYVSKIVFSDGSEKSFKGANKRAMKESTAYILAKVLQGSTRPNYASQNARLDEVKGHLVKTGSVGYDNSDMIRPDYVVSDGWVSGATKSVSVSVWNGYDSPNEYGHWIWENNNAKFDLYKSVMRHFNEGKDTSDWSKPDTVSGSGYNLSPLDTDVVKTVDYPQFSTNFDITQLLDSSKKINSSSIVQPVKPDSGVPKDYKIGDWKNQLSGDDKNIYKNWENNDLIPTISSYIDDKTYYQTN